MMKISNNDKFEFDDWYDVCVLATSCINWLNENVHVETFKDSKNVALKDSSSSHTRKKKKE